MRNGPSSSATLRATQGRRRRLRPLLRHALHPRAQLLICPLLRPDPTARPRPVQIRDNLIARIAEAESHRWLGEAEGLKVSLAGARAKLAEMDQIAARRSSTVDLGIPSFTDAAGGTVTTPATPASSERPRLRFPPPVCSILNVSGRVVSLRAQPLSGSHSPPSPRMAGGRPHYGSEILGSWPCSAPSASA
jgi:hypothetical protein